MLPWKEKWLTFQVKGVKGWRMNFGFVRARRRYDKVSNKGQRCWETDVGKCVN